MTGYLKFQLGAALAVNLLLPTHALDNGVGRVPEMGFNSWYALHGHLTYPNYTWEAGYVLADDMRSVANWFTEHGFNHLGYKYMNLDDCIVISRDPQTHVLIPDPQAFPNGVKNLSDWMHLRGYLFGWYSDRGNFTCSCYAGGPKRPGSRGYEALDAQTYADWGIDYLKEDSCNDGGVNTNGTYAQYALMRDGLNATGRPIYFNLCWGAGETVASVGRQLGNAWRIDEDDGAGWAPMLQNVDTDAALYKYSGCDPNDGFGCGWNDPGLLLVGQAGLTDVQGRTHFNLWSMLAAKLLISVDPRNFTDTSIETLTNAEVIAVDQDPLGIQAQRLVPAVTDEEVEATMERMARMQKQQAQKRQKQNVKPHNDAAATETLPGAEVELQASYTYKYRSVVDPAFDAGDATVIDVDVYDAAAVNRTEVWARPLVDGSWALLLFNRGLAQPQDITCNGTCWTSMGWGASEQVYVRDLWSHTSNSSVTGGFTAAGVVTNGSVMVKLSKTQL